MPLPLVHMIISACCSSTSRYGSKQIGRSYAIRGRRNDARQVRGWG